MSMINLDASAPRVPGITIPQVKTQAGPLTIPACQLPEGVETVSREEMDQGPGLGKFFTRPYMMTQERQAAIQISTSQGDKVTLTYERSEFRRDYLRSQGGYVPGLPIVHNTEDAFSMTVDGDLDDRELADIQAFKKALHGVIEGFLSRQTTGETLDDLDMAEFSALTEYAVALNSAGYMSWATDMVRGYHPMDGENPLPGPDHKPRPEAGTAPGDTASGDQAVGPSQEPGPPKTMSNSAPPAPHTMASETRIDRLSLLKTVTESVFKEAVESTGDDARRDALNSLSQKFSELVENLITLFADTSGGRTFFDR